MRGSVGSVGGAFFAVPSPFMQISRHCCLFVQRVAMLHRVADALLAHQDEILAENAKDMEEAQVSPGHAWAAHRGA